MKILYILPLFLLLMACGEQGGKETTEENNENKDTTEVVKENEQEPETTQNAPSLEDQWEKFKQAILEKDKKKVKMLSYNEDLDWEMLFTLFEPDDFHKGLEATTFKDGIKNDTGQLEFAVTEEGVDEDGNEVGAGVFLYFSVKDGKMTLENYLAAG